MLNKTICGQSAGQAQVHFAEFISEFNGNRLELTQYFDEIQNGFLQTPEVTQKFVFTENLDVQLK